MRDEKGEEVERAIYEWLEMNIVRSTMGLVKVTTFRGEGNWWNEEVAGKGKRGIVNEAHIGKAGVSHNAVGPDKRSGQALFSV